MRGNPDTPRREQLYPRMHPYVREGWLAACAIGNILYRTADEALKTVVAATAEEVESFRVRNATDAQFQELFQPTSSDSDQPSA